jgi:hypothetical protein
MADYGLRILNDFGELTVSSEAKIPYCLGRCNFEQIVQPAGSVNSPEPGKVAGYSRYRAWTNGPVIFAVMLPVGWYVNIPFAIEVAANVWDVYVSAGWQMDADGFLIQQEIEVYAYGIAPWVNESYGLALYDKYGTLTSDLTRPNLLYPRAFINAPTTGQNYWMPGFGRAVVFGTPNTTATTQVANYKSEYPYQNTETTGMWCRASSEAISVMRIPTSIYMTYDQAAFVARDGDNIGFILDGALLP